MIRNASAAAMAALIASSFAFGASADEIRAPGTAPRKITEDARKKQTAAPGVTNEIAPDAKETATGGPSGGLPTNH